MESTAQVLRTYHHDFESKIEIHDYLLSDILSDFLNFPWDWNVYDKIGKRKVSRQCGSACVAQDEMAN